MLTMPAIYIFMTLRVHIILWFCVLHNQYYMPQGLGRCKTLCSKHMQLVAGFQLCLLFYYFYFFDLVF